MSTLVSNQAAEVPSAMTSLRELEAVLKQVCRLDCRSQAMFALAAERAIAFWLAGPIAVEQAEEITRRSA
jgi:hypothetical protein